MTTITVSLFGPLSSLNFHTLLEQFRRQDDSRRSQPIKKLRTYAARLERADHFPVRPNPLPLEAEDFLHADYAFVHAGNLGDAHHFPGTVAFKNAASVRQVAAGLSLGEFMVETDCPYLAPTPFRGKRCEPAHTRLIAESIAEARGISLEELSRATTNTAKEFFRLNG